MQAVLLAKIWMLQRYSLAAAGVATEGTQESGWLYSAHIVRSTVHCPQSPVQIQSDLLPNPQGVFQIGATAPY